MITTEQLTEIRNDADFDKLSSRDIALRYNILEKEAIGIIAHDRYQVTERLVTDDVLIARINSLPEEPLYWHEIFAHIKGNPRYTG